MDIIAEYEKAVEAHAEAVAAVDAQRDVCINETLKMRGLKDKAAFAAATVKGLKAGADQAKQLLARKEQAAEQAAQ